MLSYCTNVHAGASLHEVKANLDHHAGQVRDLVCPRDSLGIGLWLSAVAARELLSSDGVNEFRDWLADRCLAVSTINGFPFADFHQPVVKHAVYQPDWRDSARAEYTRDLLTILAGLLPDSTEGSISTLPLGWRSCVHANDDLARCAAQLAAVLETARLLEEQAGRYIHIDIEPEPGCTLERSSQLVDFICLHLDTIAPPQLVRRYLRVCHDICHAAVMFEDQAEMLKRYDDAGITIGKVQVSSAVRCDFDSLPPAERPAALAQLRAFNEPRYLHQTVVHHEGKLRFFDDLPFALDACPAAGEWRTHFHVPLFAESLGTLQTTQQEVIAAMDLFRSRPEITHYEVETYAWNVLPDQSLAPSLAAGIARELTWLIALARSRTT